MQTHYEAAIYEAVLLLVFVGIMYILAKMNFTNYLIERDTNYS